MISYPAGIGGITTRVLEAGSGDDVVVLIHGVAARADRWRYNLDALADAGYRAFAFDLPGHGFAEKGPGDRYSVPHFAATVGAFLDWVGTPTAHLVGTSLGGHTVGYYAAHHPERVRSLALVGSVGLVPLGAERRQQTAARLGIATREGVIAKFGILVHDQSLVTENWIAEEIRVNSSPGAAEAFAVLGPQLGVLNASGRFPVVLIWGAQEIAFPLSMGFEAQKVITGSSLVAIEGTSHAPYLERPEAFNNVLIDFLGNTLGRWQGDGITYHSARP
jgi:pimeloyl-ACP methyl ester carboxylesterase